MNSAFDKLNPFDEESGDLNVVIDTPKRSRNKYAYDEKIGLFVLKGVLTVGHSFPYDFGFIPQTKGGDGDPLDVLVLMDEAAFAGCLVPSPSRRRYRSRANRKRRKSRAQRQIDCRCRKLAHSRRREINQRFE